jgi:hypothetical protein
MKAIVHYSKERVEYVDIPDDLVGAFKAAEQYIQAGAWRVGIEMSFGSEYLCYESHSDCGGNIFWRRPKAEPKKQP